MEDIKHSGFTSNMSVQDGTKVLYCIIQHYFRTILVSMEAYGRLSGWMKGMQSPEVMSNKSLPYIVTQKCLIWSHIHIK